MSFTLPRTSFA